MFINLKVRIKKMIKCKNECPLGKFEGCCFFCEVKGCKEKCTEAPSDCDSAIQIAETNAFDEEKALAEFQGNQIALLQNIASLVKQKKEIEAQEADLKVKLQEAMEAYGFKKFTSDVLNIIYIAATTSVSLDSAKLKKKYPEIAAECSKTSNKKAYIKIEVK